MKKLFASLLFPLFLLIAAQSFAQPDPAARAAAMKQKLITDLKLTDVQADSVVAISQATMPQRRALFQDQSLSREDKQAKMKALTDSSDVRIKAVLGDDGLKKYQDWRKNNRPQRGGGS